MNYELKLKELQNEQILLIANNGKRKKANRIRVNQITKEFFALKEEWRKSNK